MQCEPCPCNFITFNMIVGTAALIIFGFLWFVDYKVENASDNDALSEHVSILLAPMLILVTFGQTIALFLDLVTIPWPPLLRKMMQWLSSLNINLEMTKPECTTSVCRIYQPQLVSHLCLNCNFALCSSVLLTRHDSQYSRQWF